MNDKFKLLTFNNSVYQYISFSVDYSRPDEYLSDLAMELAQRKFSGYIIFDLLLCNGLNSQRYIKSFFDGSNFQYDSFSTMSDKELDVSLKQFTSNFYLTHKELLDRSVLLSKAQKFLIRKGLNS